MKHFSRFITCLSAVCLSFPANADIVSSSIISQYNLNSHTNSLFLIDGGNVAVTGGAAVVGTGNPAVPSSNTFHLGINLNDITKGISSDQEAVKVTDDIIDLRMSEFSGTAARITSSIAGTSSGTIAVIDSKQGTNQIVIGSSFSSNASVTNTAVSGVAINFHNSTSHFDAFNVSNFGIISANNHSNSYGIKFFSAETGSIFNLNNFGTISAGLLGHAIAVESNNEARITTTGTITGSIELGSNSASYLNVNGGTINGNISGAGTITVDSARINGNIVLSSATTLNINDGAWVGNAASVNSIDGVSNGVGNINAASNALIVMDSDIGINHKVGNFVIGSNTNFVMSGHYIAANNITLGGILNLNVDSGTTIDGNLTGTGSGAINLHNLSSSFINGSMTLLAG